VTAIRVLIAQRKALLRGALAVLIQSEPDLRVVAQVASGPEVIPAAERSTPDVVILHDDLVDAELWSLATELLSSVPDVRVLIIADAQRCGAPPLAARIDLDRLGLLTTTASPRRLRSAVRGLASGNTVIDADFLVVSVTTMDNPLTAREREILGMVAQGVPVPEIATGLQLSTRTVRNHLSRVSMKTQARTRIEAVRIARDAGWL
jgi:two-component system, NarL family, response regulator DesR